MATTMNPTKTRSTNGGAATAARKNGAAPRVRGSARGAAGATNGREAKYDLLTAALLGLAIGAGTTLLLRRGPSGGRPIGPAWRAARKGARLAGRGARFAWQHGSEAGANLWDRIPREEIEEKVRDYFSSARDTIDHLVESELNDLRRAIRRRRKKLGI